MKHDFRCVCMNTFVCVCVGMDVGITNGCVCSMENVFLTKMSFESTKVRIAHC